MKKQECENCESLRLSFNYANDLYRQEVGKSASLFFENEEMKYFYKSKIYKIMLKICFFNIVLTNIVFGLFLWLS